MRKQLEFLMVDDDGDDTFLFGYALKEIDPSVRFSSVKDGKEAIDYLSANPTLPDLIFLDLNMPRVSGKECLAFLKGNDRLKKLPVIIYTTSSQSKDIEESLMSGALCFITKPSSPKELKQILTALIDALPDHLARSINLLSKQVNTFIVI